jgi:hypothetical protein
MRFRKLRIAWTVVCGLAGAATIALWIHSYWARDFCYVTIGKRFVLLQSVGGEVGFSSAPWMVDPIAWSVRSDDAQPLLSLWESTWSGSNRPNGIDLGWKFRWRKTEAVAGTAYIATLPHWFPLLLLAALAVLPWTGLKWRFGLRAMLVAVTLVALGLGLVAYVISR